MRTLREIRTDVCPVSSFLDQVSSAAYLFSYGYTRIFIVSLGPQHTTARANS